MARGTQGILARALFAVVLLVTACGAPKPAPVSVAGQTISPTTAVAEPTATPIPKPTPALDPRFGIAESFRNPAAMASIGAGWSRLVFSWRDIQPTGPDDFSYLGRTLPKAAFDAELARGVKLAGLLQFTPDWAATDLSDSGRSAPQNLYLPFDHPDNYWGQFVYRTVQFYGGKVDEWILWNEPEFRPEDAGAGGSYTWLGSDEDFAQLLRVGYLAAKKANPKAVVSFPGTSYWIEELSSPRRPQFYDRILTILDHEADSAANSYYHDAVSLNLYRAPDDLVRVHDVFTRIQQAHGLDKPMWLLELNAMPTDDPSIPCADRHAASPFQTTMQEQADYAIQSLALAAATGYQRIGFYQMVDGDTCDQPAVWGVTRDDLTARPVADSLKTAVTQLSAYNRAEFTPVVRATQPWSAWPADQSSFTPSWQIYQVALDKPGGARVRVLWSGDGADLTIRVPAQANTARLLDSTGAEQPLARDGDDWLIKLPAATAHFPLDPPGYFFIGGSPLILVEQNVAPGALAAPPVVEHNL